MPAKKKQRKAKKSYNKRKANKKQNLNWSICGLVVFWVSKLQI